MKPTDRTLWNSAGAAACALLALLLPQLSGAGGIIVGNARTVEQNVVFAYIALPKAIDQCLTLRALCPLDARELRLISRIRQITVDHPFSLERVEFASQSAHPESFLPDLWTEHGIAQTEIGNPEAPIRWNQDLFYRKDGTACLDLALITAIWIHELGHQAGEPNHELLDGLGGKVRNLLSEQILKDVYPERMVDQASVNLTLTRINYFGPASMSDLYINDGEHGYSMSNALDMSARCSEPSQTRVGWTLNTATFSTRMRVAGGASSVSYKSWLTVRCLKGAELLEEDKELNVVVQMTKKNGRFDIQSLRVSVIPLSE